LEARPEHYGYDGKKSWDMIPPFQQIGRRSVWFGWRVVRLTHYRKELQKRA
jgi:ribosome modulation factor